jgi:hypothetical protein
MEMSDVPWAVAWYGNRQCVWLSLNAQDQFYAINAIKPVCALYLTPQTMDGKFVSQWMEGDERGWGRFVYAILKDERIGDENFPLTHAPSGFFPEQLFLSDRDRWSAAK